MVIKVDAEVLSRLMTSDCLRDTDKIKLPQLRCIRFTSYFISFCIVNILQPAIMSCTWGDPHTAIIKYDSSRVSRLTTEEQHLQQAELSDKPQVGLPVEHITSQR